MRFSLSETMGTYQDWLEMGVAAEEAGFDAFSTPDSVFYPEKTDSVYPYNETDAIRRYIENTPFIEPMVAFAWMAARTKKLRFFPNVMKSASRAPILLAKQICSLATISNNRFIYGAGIGPWEEDFTYNGLDWSKRGELLDESIEILRGLMTGDLFAYEGKHNKFGPIKINPVPTAPVPIVIGGHSKPALRRAAKMGDGWTVVNMDFDLMKTTIAELHEFRRAYGTDHKDFQIHARQYNIRTASQEPPDLGSYRKFEDIGVTDYCIVLFPTRDVPLQTKLDEIKRFGDEVISKL